MLDIMRKGAQNIVVKALLLILALSFVVWGIGDIFRGRSSNNIAVIGDEAIAVGDYQKMLRQEIDRFQDMMGKNITPEQIELLGIKNNVLQRLVTQRLLSNRVEELGLYVGDKPVIEKLKQNQMFQDANGEFDEVAFKTILRNNNVSEKSYINYIKNDISINFLLGSLIANEVVIDDVAKAVYRHNNEQRVADLIYVPKDFIKNVEEPSETDLVQFYQENLRDFTYPEFRAVSYVTFDQSNAPKVEIADEELKAKYNERIDEYTKPERRDVAQYLFDDEESAKEASNTLKENKEIDQKKIELGKVSKDDLPQEISEVAFSIDEMQYSNPIKSDLGWHILYVNSVVAPEVESFDSVKQDIKNSMLSELANENLYNMVNEIEDELAEGKALEEIASSYNLSIKKISSINSKGELQNGKTESLLPDKELTLPMIFQAEVKIPSSVTMLNDQATYIVLAVDEVFPQRVMALDEVKGRAITMWKNRKKAEEVKKKANEIMASLKSGKSVSELASGKDLSIKVAQNFKRVGGLDEKIPMQFQKELYSLKPDGVTKPYRIEDGSYVIAKLSKVLPASSDNDAKGFEKVKLDLKQQFSQDLLDQYNVFLRKEYPVSINYEAVNASY